MQYSLDPDVVDRFNKKIDKSGECWNWTACLSKGYGAFSIGRKMNNVRANRYAFYLANGFIDDDKFVCHTCDNPLCVNPDHLYLGTPKDNVNDREKRGRGFLSNNYVDYRGEKMGGAKLTWIKVAEIRKLYTTQKITQQELADKFGVGHSIISDIITFKKWKI
jgi:hypothetical protein